MARAAGEQLLVPQARTGIVGPERVVIDSREAGPGALFVGLRGAKADGGEFAAQALQAGAWGVLAGTEHAPAAAEAATADQVVLESEDPLYALQRLATAWRRELSAKVIGVTGSTGKTSTKDITRALVSPQRRTVASRANFNTEIGLPLELLAAPTGTEVLILEMAMRGPHQISELAEIAEPDVGVIVNVGPVHLELLGSLEAIAAAKAELIAALAPGATAVIPVNEPLLSAHLRPDLDTVTFGGEGAEVRLLESAAEHVVIDHRGERVELDVPFRQAHLRTNLLAGVAAAIAVGVQPHGRVELELSSGRGQIVALPDDVTLIDDAYNANPVSVAAALTELAALVAAAGDREMRSVAVLGDMLELGRAAADYHRQVGRAALEARVELLITVGPLAATMTEEFEGESYAVADAQEAAALVVELLAPGDVVLVKGSRGVGLEAVCQALSAGAPA